MEKLQCLFLYHSFLEIYWKSSILFVLCFQLIGKSKFGGFFLQFGEFVLKFGDFFKGWFDEFAFHVTYWHVQFVDLQEIKEMALNKFFTSTLNMFSNSLHKTSLVLV